MNKCCCGSEIEHRRVGLCSPCYKNKRRQDWKKNHKARIAKSDDYLLNRRAINSKAANKWRKDNRDRVNHIQQERCRTDIDFRLRRTLRKRISEAVKNKSKNSSAVSDLGCSIEEFRKHLESQFQPGMSWDNYGDWHIDHIEPLSKFNLESITDFKKACHYKNMQPLWKEDHFVKTAKENGQTLSKATRRLS